LNGFSLRLLGLEVRRLLRNRQRMLFVVAMPVVFFLLFGLNSSYATLPDGRGNVSAFIMISMALYGAVLSATGGGAAVALERAAGWSRQLRVTPLSPTAYIAMKMGASLILGLTAVVAVYGVAWLTHRPALPGVLWLITGLSVWIGSLLFSALGLFLGYLLPADNVMQIVSFLLVLLAFGGGLFIPLQEFPAIVQTLARFTPLYGLNQLVHYPMVGGVLHWTWGANLVGWLAVFVVGATALFRRDTARV